MGKMVLNLIYRYITNSITVVYSAWKLGLELKDVLVNFNMLCLNFCFRNNSLVLQTVRIGLINHPC